MFNQHSVLTDFGFYQRKQSPRPHSFQYGFFIAGEIEQSFEGYVFHDLVLPFCSIRSVILTSDYLDGGNTHTLREWQNYNSSQDDFSPRVAPVYLTYALMSAAYLKKDSKSVLVNKLRDDVFIRDAQYCALNSTSVKYRRERPPYVAHGLGWGDSLLRRESNNRTFFGFHSAPLRQRTQGVVPALETLLYETNPSRVVQTLSWAFRSKRHYCELDREMKHSKCEQSVTLDYDFERGYPFIGSNEVNWARPARGVIVRSEDIRLHFQ